MSAGDVEVLEQEIQRLTEENSRLVEDNKTLTTRCKKLARAVPAKTDASTQTEETAPDNRDAANAGDTPMPVVQGMLRHPLDETLQLQGLETLFAQSTQVGGDTGALQGALHALQAGVAILANHRGNRQLLLKASQFLSLLLTEPNVQQQLPVTVLVEAAVQVVSVSDSFLKLTGESVTASGPSISKLLTWFMSLLSALLPCLKSCLEAKGQELMSNFFSNVMSPLLASAELPNEDLMLKCMQLLPLLPPDAWIQKMCLDSGAVHSLALTFHRFGSPKVARAALHWVFADNLELCVKALDDTFVSDEFVCLEVLEVLHFMEKKKRGVLRVLDSDWGFLGKALGLWTFHQRRALEDPNPTSKEVLVKLAGLVTEVLMSLPPQKLPQRMSEFRAEPFQRIALAAIHGSPQLQMQVAVGFVDNGIIPVVIADMQMILRHYEQETPSDVFALLQDERWPGEGWSYISHCLDVCLHILSHWSATLALRQKDVLDTRAAPLLLAQSGLVDVLAQLIDAEAAGMAVHTKPPARIETKASDTLQALFEQSGHICLFCMQHFTDVKQVVAMGCDILAQDPLRDFPDMQQQAVEQLCASSQKFFTDECLSTKILKSLAVLFESSYRLVVWFLRRHSLAQFGNHPEIHVEAVRAVARAPYWSNEDSELIPDFVAAIAELIMSSVDETPEKAKLDLTEAEELASSCTGALLHLLLIDPTPPSALHCLADSLGRPVPTSTDDELPPLEDIGNSEAAVSAMMRIMEVFPSSDRLQLNCQHILTSLLGA